MPLYFTFSVSTNKLSIDYCQAKNNAILCSKCYIQRIGQKLLKEMMDSVRLSVEFSYHVLKQFLFT